MGWKNRISRFNGKMTKEKWLLLLLIGVLLMILSFPLPGGSKKDKNTGGQIAGAGTEGAGAVPLWTMDNTNGSGEDSGFGQGSSQNGMAQGRTEMGQAHQTAGKIPTRRRPAHPRTDPMKHRWKTESGIY